MLSLLDFLRSSLCLEKLAIFEQIWIKILREYEHIWSKNFDKDAKKSNFNEQMEFRKRSISPLRNDRFPARFLQSGLKISLRF